MREVHEVHGESAIGDGGVFSIAEPLQPDPFHGFTPERTESKITGQKAATHGSWENDCRTQIECLDWLTACRVLNGTITIEIVNETTRTTETLTRNTNTR